MSAVESFNRPEVVNFLEKAVKAYKPKGKILLILPCSAKKLYSTSRSHTIIRSVVKRGIEEIIVSSPLVVPRVFELVYPAVNYDVPVTGHWSDDEIRYASKWLCEFLSKGEFEVVIAHVEGGYKRVVEATAKEMGLDVMWTAEKDITSAESLKRLKDVMDKIEVEKFDLYKAIFEHMLRYQFDVEDIDLKSVKGRYPNLEFYADKRLARVDVNYGCLDVDIELAKFLINRKSYFVEIDEFIPKGTIFAVGVKKADERLKPNDVVVFYNSQVIGVGRALMTGKEMTSCRHSFIHSFSK